ncbi:NIPSNAP family protein [Micromonospora echinofusca]|uniref:NIPSNAP family containing protein n=1 Tax=Micromonospora echinofusca TaxID=47858 RepID=A0ABS3VM25_MICEH|nr:NIPSNAP family protein [Micromonospora echinofusca]MBO4205591.1 NIPSNAP family containing protein [Micromonospora echinofusca]
MSVARTVQIRTYTVREGLLDEWVDRWQRLVVPLRRDLGFGIHGSWKDRTRHQHIWVISYDGPGSFGEANAAYWASERRKTLGLNPDDYLVGEEIREVEQTL